MRSTVATALVAAALAGPAVARAQAHEEVAQATVVAPSRREEALFESTRAASVDATAAARRALARDVGERLDELPGVFVQRTTSASAAPILRGLGGQRVLLLFDELRLDDALTKVGGNALLTLVDPAVVQRVEVVRGPASVMYGSDALGGVVSVTPVDAQPRDDGAFRWRGEAMLRGASAERQVAGLAMVEGELGPVGLVLGGSLGHTGRVIAGGALGAQRFTGYDDRALSVRATARVGGTHRLGAAFHTSALLDAPRPDLSTPDDVRTFRLQQRELAYVTWRAGTERLGVSARAGAIVRTEHRDRARGARLDTERDQVRTGVASVTVHAAVGGARVSVGAEASWDDVQSGTVTVREGASPTASRGRYLEGSSYLTGGVWAFYRQRLGARVTGEAGARLAVMRAAAPADGATAAMDRWLVAPVGSLGLRVLVADGVALVASGMTGFRAPNLDDFQALGSGARSFDVPEAGLGAERSWTAEGGVRVMRGEWQASAFVYAAWLTGLVVRVPGVWQGMTVVDGRRVYTRANASDAAMWGAELDVTWRHRSGVYASVAAMYAHGDATFPDDAGNAVTEPMAKLPPATGRAALGWRNARVWVDAVLTGGLPQTRLASSDRDDVRVCPAGPAGCTEAPGWSSLALRGGWNASAQVTLGAAIENVWNGAFTPYGSGAPAPGVNVLAMLRLRAR